MSWIEKWHNQKQAFTYTGFKLEWVAYPFFNRPSWPRNWTGVSCIAGGFFTNWAIREAQSVFLKGDKTTELVSCHSFSARIKADAYEWA